MGTFGPLLKALNETGARYVVVDGLAVVLHGYARLTADLDLIVDLQQDEALRVIEALEGIGLAPSVPVRAKDFASADVRASWIRDKGMVVFSMTDPLDPFRTVDLFVEPPLPFEDLYARAVEVQLQDLSVRIASIEDLIFLKRIAGRPRDIDDIAALEAIRDG